jgi:proteic killer suppression protein
MPSMPRVCSPPAPVSIARFRRPWHVDLRYYSRLTVLSKSHIIHGVIRSFGCEETEAIFRRRRGKLLSGKLKRVAYRKLAMLHAAVRLDDLSVPPGNRLEALKGDRRGQYSIRINDRWRVCFVWREGSAHDVAIVDYH